jgi:hypothetical protein
MNRKTFLALAIAICGCSSGGSSAIAQPPTWKTGVEFRRQLQQPVTFTWADNPLRPALLSLAESQGIAVFVDRRIDPSRKLDIEVDQLPLEAALHRIADEVEIDFCLLGSVAYLGPPQVTDKLATLAAVKRQRISQLPDGVGQRFLTLGVWQWDLLATPRELVQELAGRARVRVTNIEELPHDLWPAVELPEMPLADRLSLVLANFSSTYDVSRDGTLIRITPMPEEVTFTKRYRVRTNLVNKLQRVKELFPNTDARRVAGSIEVRGSFEEHGLVDRYLRGETVQRTQVAGTEKRFKLNLQDAPVGAILNTLVRQLKLVVEVDPQAQPKLEQVVQVQVTDATLEELLNAALEPAGLSFQLDGHKLTVRLAEDP